MNYAEKINPEKLDMGSNESFLFFQELAVFEKFPEGVKITGESKKI